jgi:hypothetical protein
LDEKRTERVGRTKGSKRRRGRRSEGKEEGEGKVKRKTGKLLRKRKGMEKMNGIQKEHKEEKGTKGNNRDNKWMKKFLKCDEKYQGKEEGWGKVESWKKITKEKGGEGERIYERTKKHRAGRETKNKMVGMKKIVNEGGGGVIEPFHS